MEISLTTPALLFPAISLLLLAFTNRFLAIAGLIRNLYAAYQQDPNKILVEQIKNLRRRLFLIRVMQIAGIGALFMCVLCMFVLFAGYRLAGEIIFGMSLLLMMFSLSISITEIQISAKALNIQLSDMEGLGSELNINTRRLGRLWKRWKKEKQG